VELVELGWNRLCPPNSSAAIKEAVQQSLGTTGIEAAPYGQADAGAKIAELLATV
jgi:UDP-GlcNAc3NAcA epimerase